jgi:hypothetical protein
VPSKQELVEAAEAIRRIIDAVERGELDAPPGLVARLDGAARALEVLASEMNQAELHGDPVELTSTEAREIAAALVQLAAIYDA